jgi:hypothetical protein
MYEIIKPFHSYLALALLAVLIIGIMIVLMSKFSKKPFAASHLKIALIALISTHIQLLLGLVLYFISPLGFSNLIRRCDERFFRQIASSRTSNNYDYRCSPDHHRIFKS